MKPSPFNKMTEGELRECLSEQLVDIRRNNLTKKGEAVLSLGLVDRACAVMNCLAALGYVWGCDFDWLASRVHHNRTLKRGLRASPFCPLCGTRVVPREPPNA